MRDWIDITAQLLCESGETIPKTDYGYWIDPEGNFIRVGEYTTHLRMFRQATDIADASMDTAFRAGWLRVIFNTVGYRYRLIIETNTCFIGARTLMSLIRLARTDGIARFEADMAEDYYPTAKLEEFLSFVRSHRRRPNPEQEAAAAARRKALGDQFGVNLP